MQRYGSWAVLGLLLAATLIGALTFDRRSWPGLVGDEATYLMQAQSLAWDLDDVYDMKISLATPINESIAAHQCAVYPQ